VFLCPRAAADAPKMSSSVSGDEEINVDSDSVSGASDGAGSDSAPPSLLTSSHQEQSTKLPFSISRLLGADFDSKASSKLADAAWDAATYEAGLFGAPRGLPLLQHGLHYAAPGGAIIRVPAHRPPSSAPQPGANLAASPYPWLANIDPHLQRSAAFASHLVKERLTGWTFFTFTYFFFLLSRIVQSVWKYCMIINLKESGMQTFASII